MQGIVLAAPVSASEKVSARRRRIFNFLTPAPPPQPPPFKAVHLTFFHSNSRAVFEQRKPSKTCLFFPFEIWKTAVETEDAAA